MPLQAADLLASWKREAFLERGTIVDRLGPMMPWETVQANHAHLYGELNEQGMRDILGIQFARRFGFTASYQPSPSGEHWSIPEVVGS